MQKVKASAQRAQSKDYNNVAYKSRSWQLSINRNISSAMEHSKLVPIRLTCCIPFIGIRKAKVRNNENTKKHTNLHLTPPTLCNWQCDSPRMCETGSVMALVRLYHEAPVPASCLKSEEEHPQL